MTTMTPQAATSASTDATRTNTSEILDKAAAIDAQTDAGSVTQKFGASMFTADPGPAVSAVGRVYAIDATADALAIQGKATGKQADGIGVWGEGPMVGTFGTAGDDGTGVFGVGRFGVVGTLGGRRDGAAIQANGLGGVGLDAFGSTVAVRAHTNELSGFAIDASGGEVAIRATGHGAGIVSNGEIGIQAAGKTGVSASGIGGAGLGVDAFGEQEGVRGSSPKGIGVRATGMTGLSAEGSSASGVGVQATGATGLTANSTNPTGVGAVGQSAKGVGLRGHSDAGTGVQGSSELGLGGEFFGTRAPVRLVPAEGGEGLPSGSHQVGELYVDGKANLYFCVGAGSPGDWKKVTMVDVRR